jgi:murein DD-endopeptidase MepM/ murein hydrolase activator NlpD
MRKSYLRNDTFHIVLCNVYFVGFFLISLKNSYAQLSTVDMDGRTVSGKKFVVPVTAVDSENYSFGSNVDTFEAYVPMATDRVQLLQKNVVFPLKNVVTTSVFGFRFHPILRTAKFHSGIDLKAVYEGVYAFSSGLVEMAFYDDYSGNCIVLNHGNDIRSVYAHLSYIGVRIGQEVSSGCLIAISGNTGMSTAPHLHFAIKYKNAPVDPGALFKFIY